MKNKNNLTEVEYSPFDTPVPGQSLTDEPGNYPWEHPPQRATVEEALDEIYESLMQEKNMKRMFTLLRMGIPVEELFKAHNWERKGLGKMDGNRRKELQKSNGIGGNSQ